MDIRTRLLCTVGSFAPSSRAFVKGNEAVDFQPRDRDEAYGFVRNTLKRFAYQGLGKRVMGVVLRFLFAATDFSLKQMQRWSGREPQATGSRQEMAHAASKAPCAHPARSENRALVVEATA